MDTKKLLGLNSRIIKCALCPRLSRYVRQVGRDKVRRFADEEYWARPLPSWGDPNARLLIVGLAPAAHGGNRTGRMFTGDSSGDWLARAMHETGFANMPTSTSKVDGLTLKDVYITAAVRCAPPGNKPLPSELLNCSRYLESELKLLDNVRVVLALGKIGFDAYCRTAGAKRLVFGHGARYDLDGKVLLASYHPSRQNTNTGKLTWKMWQQVFRTARTILENDRGIAILEPITEELATLSNQMIEMNKLDKIAKQARFLLCESCFWCASAMTSKVIEKCPTCSASVRSTRLN